MPRVTVDGLAFNSEDLTDHGRALLASLSFVDRQLERLAQDIAICRTARDCYARDLKAELDRLPGDPAAGRGQ